MFDGALVCRVIAVPEMPFRAYEEAAGQWAGKDALEAYSGDFITWVETESAELGMSAWLVEVGPLDYRARRGIAKIGHRNGFDLIAFVSEFASVTAMMQDQFCRRLASGPSGSVGHAIRLNFDQIDEIDWRRVIHIECQTDDFVLAATATRSSLPRAPENSKILSIGVSSHGMQVIVSTQFGARISAAAEPLQLAEMLADVLSFVANCMSIENVSQTVAQA